MMRAITVREQLIQKGFWIAPEVLSTGMLEGLRGETDVFLDALPEQN